MTSCAGRARLVELVEVPPDYLKFDMKLVQNLSQASLERQKMVERLVQMTLELGIIALAEGVEHLSGPRDLPADGFRLRARFFVRPAGDGGERCAALGNLCTMGFQPVGQWVLA